MGQDRLWAWWSLAVQVRDCGSATARRNIAVPVGTHPNNHPMKTTSIFERTAKNLPATLKKLVEDIISTQSVTASLIDSCVILNVTWITQKCV